MDTTIPQLMREIAEDIQEVLRSEIRLAKVEVGEQVNRVKKVAKGVLPGAVLLFYMVGFLLLACMFALELVLAAWLAALIVAIFAGIVAAMMLGPAMREAKMVNPTPERTIQTMKENVQWAKSQLR